MDLNRETDKSKYTDQDMPRYPARVLASHLTMKAAQVGSGLGCVIAPVWAIVRNTPLQAASRIVFPFSWLVGFGTSYGFAYHLYSQGKLDNDGVDDRAYRIMKSAGQVKCDKYSFLGGLIGATAGVILGRGKKGAILAFTSVGAAAGVLLQVSQDHIMPKVEELQASGLKP